MSNLSLHSCQIQGPHNHLRTWTYSTAWNQKNTDTCNISISKNMAQGDLTMIEPNPSQKPEILHHAENPLIRPSGKVVLSCSGSVAHGFSAMVLLHRPLWVNFGPAILACQVYETLFTMRGTTGGILQHHQILRLPRKMILQNFSKISPKQMKRHLQCATDPRPFRAGSDHETVIRNPPRNRGYFSRPPRPFCIENYNISRSGYHSKFHRILRLPRKMTLELHQILRLPHKMTRIIDPHGT